jgi:hypothetical protein
MIMNKIIVLNSIDKIRLRLINDVVIFINP